MCRGLKLLAKLFVLSAACVALLDPSAAVAAGPGIHGHVMGQSDDGRLEGAIADAEVEFLRGNLIVAEATTNSSGYYKLDLVPGPYTYRVRANGYKSDNVGRQLRLQRSTGYVVRDFILVKGLDSPDKVQPVPADVGLLTGRIIAKTEQGDVGLAGAVITLRGENKKTVEQTRSVRRQGQRPPGHYEIALPFGSYRVTVRVPGFQSLIEPKPIEISAGKPVRRDFALQRMEADQALEQGIRGSVDLSLQADSQRSPTIVNLSVVKVPGNKVVADAVKLDQDGNFKQRLPTGRYRLTAKASGHRGAMSRPIDVLPHRFSTLNLRLRAQPSVAHRVMFDVVVFDEETSALLADARFQVRPAEGSTSAVGSSDSKGRVSLGVDVPGSCTIDVERAGYQRWSDTQHWSVGTHSLMVALKKSADPPTTEPANLLVTVVDAISGKPLANTDLILRRSEQPLASARRGRSDETGQQAFADCLPGDYIVAVRAKGYRTGSQRVQVNPASSQTVRVELDPVSKPPMSQLVATVLQAESNKPIAGATLTVAEQKVQRQTDTSGRATLPIAQAGTYTIVAQSKGYVPQKQGVKFDPAGSSEPVVFRLEKQTPDVTGFTFTFVDSKRRSPLAGVRAELQKQDVPARQRTTSGADGAAGFRSQGAGSYVLRAQLQGYQPLTRSLTLDPRKNEIEIALDQMTTPAMYRVQAVVSDSRQGSAIEGADVSITPSGPRATGAIRTLTGAKGDALLNVNQPGNYLVRVAADGYRSAQRVVQVTPERTLTSVEFSLQAMTTPTSEVEVNGFVVNEVSTGRLGRAGIPGATIQWRRADNVSRSVKSALLGRFNVTLPPGVYDVTIQPPSNSGYLAKTEKGITIREDAPRKPLYLRLARQVTPPGDTATETLVTGYCRASTAAGQPTQKVVVDAFLSWQGAGGKRFSARTDKAGRYQIRLQPGSYTVTVTPPKGFLRTEQRVVVPKGSAAQNFYVKAAAAPQSVEATKLSVEVRLRHPDGKRTLPMAGAVVELQQNNKTVASATSGRDGRCPSMQVAPGTYRIRATAKGYGSDTKTLVIPAQGATTTLTLTPPSVE